MNSNTFNPKGSIRYPIDSFPETTRTFIKEVASSIGAELSFPGTVMLTAISGLIGISARIELKDGYSEPAPNWTLLIAPPGNAKTPIQNLIFKFVRKIQDEMDLDYEKEIIEFKKKKIIYDAALRRWKSEYNKGIENDPPEEPIKPVRKRFLLDDASAYSIVESLADYSDGSLYVRDELSGLFKSFGDSGSGKMGLSNFLSIFSNASVRYSRRGRDLIVPSPLLALTGTTQTRVLQRIAKKNTELEDNGFWSRFLFCLQDHDPVKWSEKTVSKKTSEKFECLVRYIFNLRNFKIDTNWPMEFSLSPESYKAWQGFCDEKNMKERTTTDDFVRAGLAKFTTHLARIILTLHVLKCVETKKHFPEWPLQVDVETVANAILLIDWHEKELRKVALLLRDGDISSFDDREMIFYVLKKSDRPMLVRDVQRACGRHFDKTGGAAQVERELRNLCREDRVKVHRKKNSKGFSLEYFSLFDGVVTDENLDISEEKTGAVNDAMSGDFFVSVDSVPENTGKNSISVNQSSENNGFSENLTPDSSNEQIHTVPHATSEDTAKDEKNSTTAHSPPRTTSSIPEKLYYPQLLFTLNDGGQTIGLFHNGKYEEFMKISKGSEEMVEDFDEYFIMRMGFPNISDKETHAQIDNYYKYVECLRREIEEELLNYSVSTRVGKIQIPKDWSPEGWVSPSAKPARKTVDVPDAARMLGVSERTIYLLPQSGQIPHKRVAGRILYPIDALRRFVNETDPPKNGS